MRRCRRPRNSSMSRRERQKRRRRSRSHPVTKVMLIGAVLARLRDRAGRAAAVGWVVAVADNGPNLTRSSSHAPRTADPDLRGRRKLARLRALRHRLQRHPAREDPQRAARGHDRDRGPPLLPARRARLPGHPARRCQGPVQRPRLAAGRLDADDAARRQQVHAGEDRRYPQPEVQDHPGQARPAAGEQAQQVLDPLQLPVRRSVRNGRRVRPRSASAPPRRCSSTSRSGSSPCPSSR